MCEVGAHAYEFRLKITIAYWLSFSTFCMYTAIICQERIQPVVWGGGGNWSVIAKPNQPPK